MDTERFRTILLRKEDELRNAMAELESAARERPEEVEDPIDAVTSAQNKAAALEENTLAAETLSQVQEALERINRGTYGKCVDCGREIELARLEAVPWTRYCLEDQEKHDAENSAADGSIT